MSRLISRTILMLGLLGAIAPAVMAQRPQTREGFWFSIGVGGGSLGCEECDERSNGGVGMLAFGGKLSNTVLMAGSANGWTRSEDGATLTVGLVAVEGRFYPSSSGGFFLKAGAGIGSLDVSFGSVTVSETGAGVLAGLGYDIRVGRMISITPWVQWFGIDYDPGNANVSQLGLALTIH
jgi:hypothetical protein